MVPRCMEEVDSPIPLKHSWAGRTAESHTHFYCKAVGRRYRLVWCKQTGGGYQLCGCCGVEGRVRRWVQLKDTAEEGRPGTRVNQGWR